MKKFLVVVNIDGELNGYIIECYYYDLLELLNKLQKPFKDLGAKIVTYYQV